MNTETAPLLLIVDDARTSRMIIKGIVAKLRPTWRIVEAASGDEALLRVGEEAPAYISMDVNMPGMTGLEAAGRIRLRHPEINIVLCTANVQESIRNAAEKAGIHFVAKPINENTVTTMIAHFEQGLRGASA
jgi:two-component system chemotaxis response regulator CheY